jgi:hypothetical protein
LRTGYCERYLGLERGSNRVVEETATKYPDVEIKNNKMAVACGEFREDKTRMQNFGWET